MTFECVIMCVCVCVCSTLVGLGLATLHKLTIFLSSLEQKVVNEAECVTARQKSMKPHSLSDILSLPRMIKAYKPNLMRIWSVRTLFTKICNWKVYIFGLEVVEIWGEAWQIDHIYLSHVALMVIPSESVAVIRFVQTSTE